MENKFISMYLFRFIFAVLITTQTVFSQNKPVFKYIMHNNKDTLYFVVKNAPNPEYSFIKRKNNKSEIIEKINLGDAFVICNYQLEDFDNDKSNEVVFYEEEEMTYSLIIYKSEYLNNSFFVNKIYEKVGLGSPSVKIPGTIFNVMKLNKDKVIELFYEDNDLSMASFCLKYNKSLKGFFKFYKAY